MPPTISPQKLIWIDASAASTACAFLLTFRHFLAPLFGLPITLLNIMAIIAFCYALYGWLLVFYKRYTYKYLRPLAIANAVYGIMCIGILINHKSLSTLVEYTNTIKPLGYLYLLFDASIVFFLARIEWQVCQRQQTVNSQQ